MRLALEPGRRGDHYYVEPEAKAAGLAGDYHSGEHILGNASQGTAMGRRGDLTDGHSQAGGLGALIDLRGDDRYEGGNWVQGVGYWYGMGFLYDAAGDDRYSSVYFSTASGAHYAIGALFDMGGDDIYAMTGDPAREGGDDTYTFPQEGGCGMGAADRRERYTDPDHYDIHNANDAFFIDIGGADTYLDYFDIPGRATRPATRWKDDSDWSWQDIGDEGRLQQSFAVGLDRSEGSFWRYEVVAD